MLLSLFKNNNNLIINTEDINNDIAIIQYFGH